MLEMRDGVDLLPDDTNSRTEWIPEVCTLSVMRGKSVRCQVSGVGYQVPNGKEDEVIFNREAYKMLKPMPPFVHEMRVANRGNRKTQTRRVVQEKGLKFLAEKGIKEIVNVCPYGQPGDLRYMREPLCWGQGDLACYQDTSELARNLLTGEPIAWRWKKDVLSGMFMPKEAARTFKRYKFVRVERLQEISRQDAIAEGCPMPTQKKGMHPWPEDQYRALWDRINGKRMLPWSGNWWVWVIEYKSLQEDL